MHFVLERDRKEWNYSYQAGNTHWVMHANTHIKLSHVTAVEKTEFFFGGGAVFKYPSFYYIHFKHSGGFICPLSVILVRNYSAPPNSFQFIGDTSVRTAALED